jgi:NADH-quinone oxidoreductase subunit L
MGGLKKSLPVTYWTFLIGSLAIAGVPFLSGFFSKDEILFETFAHGHWILWIIGALTSLLTATYMFRLVFLTFHGEQRHQQDSGSHQHDSASHQHDSGSHLHDAPPAMAVVLIVLAIGSVLAGYVGVPHALGGSNLLGTWLEPAFAAPGAVAGGLRAPEEGGLELTLMIVSSVIALVGISIGAYIWLKRREIADAMARRFAGLYTLLLNKYYVDELYDAAIVRPIVVLSTEGLWRGFDVRVIDAAVNGTGTIVAASAWMMRRLQNGSVRAYASSLFIGVVLILGYYLWR